MEHSIANERYEKTWLKFLAEFEGNPRLTLTEFLHSNPVNKSGFKKWRDEHGYIVPNSRQRARRLHETTYQVNMTLQEQEIEEIGKAAPTEGNGDLATNDSSTATADTEQNWWLNVDKDTWEAEQASEGEVITLPLFGSSRNTKKDVKFLEWISRYLIDRDDNPHIGQPIAKREFAISLLDYCGITVNEKTLKAAEKRIRENLTDYIRTSDYVMNPDVVLHTPSDRKKKTRQCAAWQHSLNKDGTIQTDKDGKRLPRILDKSHHTLVYYFYRKNQKPKYSYNPSHKGDKDYVQGAMEFDPEIDYPNIQDIQPLYKAGDLIYACTSDGIVAKLKIVSLRTDQIDCVILDNLDNRPCPAGSLKKTFSEYYKLSKYRFIPLSYTESEDITESLENWVEREIEKSYTKYSKEKLLKDVFINGDILENIYERLDCKKNIILKGAPGVGKTYLAEKLAYALMGEKNPTRMCIVQFHPNYTYEDFIIGYKPNEKGEFELKPGVFMDFCNEAKKRVNSDKKYFFIIDEINRGNLGKIFGEALTLIESNYRGKPIRLANSQKKFSVPKNVYIIGLMNTADRSLAMLDFALRRRFAFFTLSPAFETEAFKAYQKALKSELFNGVIKSINDLNKAITDDPSLGEGFCIGHSYFCNQKVMDKTWLRHVIDYEIIPMLEEYWFDNVKEFNEQKEKLLAVFNDKGQ